MLKNKLLSQATSALIVFIIFEASRASASIPAAIGELVDLAQQGEPLANGDVGVEWENPRDVRAVHITGVSAEKACKLRIEWWGNKRSYVKAGGWKPLDDRWNGQWVRIKTTPTQGSKPDAWVFNFPLLTKEELGRAVPERDWYRRTLKIRVIDTEGGALPPELNIQVTGNSRWQEGSYDLDFQLAEYHDLAGYLEIVNGHILSIKGLPGPRGLAVDGNQFRVRDELGKTAGLRMRIRYVHDDLNSNALTRVTVRLGEQPGGGGFSFVPEDVPAEGAMRLPDFGALVVVSNSGFSWENLPPKPSSDWEKPVRLRVKDRPETTRESAMAAIPRLSPPAWVPLGVPSARQEFFVGPQGDWAARHRSLHFPNGRDDARFGLDKEFGKQVPVEIRAEFDTRLNPRFDGADREGMTRSLEDGYLPLIHTRWHTGPIEYHHALSTTILLGDYGNDVGRRGDETVVLLTRMEITNTSDKPSPAAVHLRFSNDTPIQLQENGLISLQTTGGPVIPDGLVAQRGMISVGKPVGGGVSGWTVKDGNDPDHSSVLSYRATLEPGESDSIYFKMTFVDLLEKDELEHFKQINFEQEIPRVMSYWEDRTTKGMQIDVPDKALMDFFKANLWHIVITTDRDPDTGLYNQGVATVNYMVCANETMMIARSMAMRGEFEEAKRFIEPMLHFQGEEELTGRFSTKENVFHSAGKYTYGHYAMNHGFVLWGVADVYFLSGDREYLDRVAPQLIKGCDFLINERHATMGAPEDSRSQVHGLSPPTSLEDVLEFKYWFATNGYYYLGLKRTAEALTDIGHPEAKRIALEAEEYRQDIEIAAREAATKAAVVRLRDGTFVPYVPSRVHQWRHLTEGWIREALYPALHLASAEVIDPNDDLIRWMLDDLEDNIFYSIESGYGVRRVDKVWFERGGVTLQPCLLDTPTIYMARNEPEAAMRSFWHTYALLIYPDVQCFAEWAMSFGTPAGPVYKTADEARFVMWLRNFLVWENGDQLWFGRAMPKLWLEDGKTVRITNAATRFGTTGLVLRSEIAQGRILATIELPTRRPPREVWLRLRHPGGQQPRRVSVNNHLLTSDQLVGQDIRLTSEQSTENRILEVVAEYEIPEE